MTWVPEGIFISNGVIGKILKDLDIGWLKQ